MTERMKAFLQKVSADEALAAQVGALGQDGLIALAEGMGLALTAADFAEASDELEDEELDAVAGGWRRSGDRNCACVVVGSGQEIVGDRRTVFLTGPEDIRDGGER